MPSKNDLANLVKKRPARPLVKIRAAPDYDGHGRSPGYRTAGVSRRDVGRKTLTMLMRRSITNGWGYHAGALTNAPALSRPAGRVKSWNSVREIRKATEMSRTLPNRDPHGATEQGK
jgi:hypothetical protein